MPPGPGATPLHLAGLPRQTRAETTTNYPPAVVEAILATLTEGVLVHDAAGQKIGSNEAADRIIALVRVDPSCPNHESLNAPLLHEDGSLWDVAHLPTRRALVTGAVQPPAIIGVRNELGLIRWLSVKATPVRENRTGVVTSVVSTLTDITELRATRSAAAEAEARYRLLADASTDVVSVLGADNRVRYVSPASLSVLGKPPAVLVGMAQTAGLIHADEHEARLEALTSIRGPETSARYTARFLMADGSWRWMETTLRPLVAGDPTTEILAVTRDVDDQHRFSAEIEQLALTDALTGLANRAQFAGRLERVQRRLNGPPGRTPVGAGLLLIDLDEFKAINDSFGHQIGDLLLQAVAGRMSSGSRPGDTLARLGGDEFAILLTHLGNPSDAAAVASRLTADLAAPYELVGATVSCTASLGLALVTPHETSQSLYRRADAALYEAKAAGRHTWMLAPDPPPSGG